MPGPTTEILYEDLRELRGGYDRLAAQTAKVAAEFTIAKGLLGLIAATIIGGFGTGFYWAGSISTSVKQLQEGLSEVRTEVKASLGEVKAEVKASLGEVKAEVKELKTEVKAISARLDRLEARFDQLNSRFDRLEARFDRLEEAITKALAAKAASKP